MKIGVAIPNFNHAKYLTDTLKSVYSQSLQPAKLVVIDDGSTDKSRDVIWVNKKHISIMAFNKHAGISATKNDCLYHLMHACDALLFLDADNELLPNCLQVLSSGLENADISYGDYSRFGYINDEHVSPGEFSVNRLINYANIPCFGMVRTDFLQRNCLRFDETLTLFEDWDFWVRCVANGARVKYIPELVYRYRTYEPSCKDSITNREKPNEAQNLKAMRERNMRLLCSM